MEPQDPAAPSASWAESASSLAALLRGNGEDGGDPSTAKAASRIERACRDLLARAPDAAGSGEGEGDEFPAEVHSVVTAIYLRALLQSGQFSAAVEYCTANFNREDGDLAHAAEEAYALYRLRKYDACRRLCEAAFAAEGGEEGSVGRGLRHTHAQALYRLGETTEADAAYRHLLRDDTDKTNAAAGEGDPATDDDEREDALSNALANATANYTPGSLLSAAEGAAVWAEDEAAVRRLLARYGRSGPAADNADGDDDGGEEGDGDGGEGEELLQNYDLAYNLATYLLVSADARNRSHLLRARRLLEHAEASALTVLDSSSATEDEEGEGDEEAARAATIAKEVARRKALQVAEREAGPIRANLALARMLLGGEENQTAALQGYLALVAAASRSKNKGPQGAAEANVAAAASNNLAVLKDGKESVFDTFKRIPTTSAASVAEDAVAGGKGGKPKDKGGTDKGNSATNAVPLAGATPCQARAALCNRALLLAKMGNEKGCKEALGALRAALRIAYRGDDAGDTKGTPKAGYMGDVPTARPASEAAAAAWTARADLLESELRRASEADDPSHADALDAALAKLDHSDDGVAAYATSQLLLHRAVAADPNASNAEARLEALASLPAAVRSRPGTIATTAALRASLNHDGEAARLLSSLGDGAAARRAVAAFQLAQGDYDGAVEALQTLVEESDGAAKLEATALLVEALSRADPTKAEEYWGTLQEALAAETVGETEVDGEALEAMDIPRFAKKAQGGDNNGGGGGTAKVRKMIAATGAKRGSAVGERAKASREAVLRKRARQRAAYLARLASEGRYDPAKTPPTKPDPERWLPKSQRSYNRRGRRGRHKSNTGAQGGGAGMERDAAKLDVAARAARKEEGGGGEGGGTPSTANLKVSSGGAARKGKGGRRR
ncbi:hypothetical protein ACHAXT_006462 [Thalassiosira profunda]